MKLDLQQRLRARPPRRVLVIQTAYLGDTVFTSALVGALARRWAVDLCVALRSRDVARAIPGVGQVHVFDKTGADRGLSGLRRMAARLAGYDLAVLPHRSLRTALLAWLAHVPERVGFAGSLPALLYTERVHTSEKAFLRQEADLARALGVEPGPMLLRPLPEWIASARAALGTSDKLAALCVGSEWETKIWPIGRMAALARLLEARGLRPVLLGGPREKALAAQIPGCIDTTGNPVGEALAIISMSALCIGGDTGLVHAARALGVPTVALFGPTDPGAHDFAPRQRAVSLGLSCSPCTAHGSRRCPLGHHRCMRDLDEQRVLSACETVLGA
ncbi:MAG TPA: glycosyltransferase family 9 protein [Myxococcales bacterium]